MRNYSNTEASLWVKYEIFNFDAENRRQTILDQKNYAQIKHTLSYGPFYIFGKAQILSI